MNMSFNSTPSGIVDGGAESVLSLYEGLNKELKDESIDDVSVMQIIKSSGVSRSTFYRYFYDKYQLLNAYYDTVLNRTLYRCKKDLTWKESVLSIYGEIKSNLLFYQNALKSHEMNCLRDHILKISNDLHFSILKKNKVDLDDWKNRKLMQSYIFGNFDLMCLWISEGMKEPVVEMSDLMLSRLPEQFAPYFK